MHSRHKTLAAALRALCCACALFAVLAAAGCTSAPGHDVVDVDLKQGRSAAAHNTQTLQHAINAASYAGGGELRLPAGTYYFSWSHEDE